MIDSKPFHGETGKQKVQTKCLNANPLEYVRHRSSTTTLSKDRANTSNQANGHRAECACDGGNARPAKQPLGAVEWNVGWASRCRASGATSSATSEVGAIGTNGSGLINELASRVLAETFGTDRVPEGCAAVGGETRTKGLAGRTSLRGVGVSRRRYFLWAAILYDQELEIG